MSFLKYLLSCQMCEEIVCFRETSHDKLHFQSVYDPRYSHLLTAYETLLLEKIKYLADKVCSLKLKCKSQNVVLSVESAQSTSFFTKGFAEKIMKLFFSIERKMFNFCLLGVGQQVPVCVGLPQLTPVLSQFLAWLLYVHCCHIGS